MASVTENPYLKVLRGRIRNLRKNIDKLDRLEQLANQGAVLNSQQLESLRNKASRQAALWELEDILVRMTSIVPKEEVLSSVKAKGKEDPKETHQTFTIEKQPHQKVAELDPSSGSSLLLESAVQAEEDGVEQLNKKQQQEEALVQNILTILHVSDFIVNEPEAVETIVKENLELPQGKFGKLSRVHMDSVNYFAKMLTSPDGDIPIERALLVSTYHAMEYLQRSKKEAIPGISYEFLHEIISTIASHPLLVFRGVNNSSNMSTQRESQLVENVVEQINFFAQPVEDEMDSGIDSINNLQIGDSSIVISGDSAFPDSHPVDSLKGSSYLDFTLNNNPSRIMIDDDNILIIQDENADNPLDHFIASSARDISLEESISRSVFADTDPFMKSNSSNRQNGNLYKKNNIDRMINEFISSQEPASERAYTGLDKSSREDTVSMQFFHRNNINEVSFLDWADEETHHSSEETYDMKFEPNSGMPKRILSLTGNVKLNHGSQNSKSQMETEDDRLGGQRMRNMESDKLRWSKNRNKHSQYTSRQGLEGERNKIHNRQPLWTRRDTRRSDNGKQSF
ncbi:uncharacterized protein Gasu_09950 [Galdieria sulphuraria]|uniref:Uncharacterized protein n=1 Tax=Galdieria sulphuraria TaxID=130081 RepID=M2X619_GALSU|nr:uncharacterized protein Gasu_09950 [Galdieria sulphuraria]EME31930.1 hypothetical protein Gasu_09950 [Galdieria sulphuraria]|eukprot:XP_005708450.1 hypothetical protein Gasu_09950 [Galdieria sulphuraria]